MQNVTIGQELSSETHTREAQSRRAQTTHTNNNYLQLAEKYTQQTVISSYMGKRKTSKKMFPKNQRKQLKNAKKQDYTNWTEVERAQRMHNWSCQHCNDGDKQSKVGQAERVADDSGAGKSQPSDLGRFR